MQEHEPSHIIWLITVSLSQTALQVFPPQIIVAPTHPEPLHVSVHGPSGLHNNVMFWHPPGSHTTSHREPPMQLMVMLLH